MSNQVNRRWQIEHWKNGKLSWTQPFIGTRGEAERAMFSYQLEAEKFAISGEFKLTGGKPV